MKLYTYIDRLENDHIVFMCLADTMKDADAALKLMLMIDVIFCPNLEVIVDF